MNTPTQASSRDLMASIRRVFSSRDSHMTLVLILAIVVATILVPRFSQPRTLTFLTLDVTATLLMALPMTLVMINADIDLSVASTAGLVSASFGVLVQSGVGFWASIAICLLIGLACGLVNAIMTAYVGLPALAVTIGTLALYRGLALVVIGDQSISDFPKWATSAVTGSFGSTGIAYMAIPVIAFVVLFWLLLHKTPYGRGLFALGYSKQAAEFVGIDTKRSRVIALTLSGLMAALAGIYWTLRYSAAKADNVEGLELVVIAAVVFGGVSVFGGRGSIWGSVCGVLTIGVLNYALRLNRIPEVILVLVTGLLLIGSVVAPSLVDAIRQRLAHQADARTPRASVAPGAASA